MHGLLIFIILAHRLALVIQLLVPPVEHLFSTLLACGRAGSINIDFFVPAPDADVLDSAHFFSPNCRVAHIVPPKASAEVPSRVK
jgi:hypothetical protein